MAQAEVSTGPKQSPTSPRHSSTSCRALTLVTSGNHLDDHSHYLNHPHEQDDSDNGESLHGDDDAEKESSETTEDLQDMPKDEDLQPEVVERVRDVETGLSLHKSNSKSVKDPNLVQWEGPDDPANPKNWPKRRRWAATIIVSCFTFISPVSSSMVAPALTSLAAEYNISNSVELSLTLSIFVLAYAIGPLFLGPLSEIYGRVVIVQLSNLFYLCFNIGCGFAKTKEQMIIFRFFSGLGGSAPLAIGGGVLSDLFRPEERGRAVSIYSLAPLLGPAIGPVAGGFISANASWRWVFWATSVADAVIQISGLFLLQETYPPVLLHRKKLKLIQETGNTALYTEYDHPDRTVLKTLEISLSRPFKLLFTQIIIQVLALYMAYLYGLIYLVLSTFPNLWSTTYHESIGLGGLNFISLGIGFFLGAQIASPLQDKIYSKLKARSADDKGQPEFRIPMMMPGAILVPIGLLWYGWTAESATYWILPNIGAVIFAGGAIIGFQCIQTYIVDSYTRYAASAIGAVTVLRSLAGFGFPLFAPYMYQSLGYGWGNSVLALLAVVLGWPAPVLLWIYGARLRKKSTFAAG